ncbi:MAG: prolyl oligopeptidase family serine peptidase, partial [Nocardioidaceae bacterium]
TDFVTPPVVLRFDGSTSTVSEWARPPGPVPDTSGVSARLVDYTSYDGETIRMFVIEPGEAGGPRPAILYGYGGFGISMTPGFSPGALAWVEAGGVYAVACLRGGGEEGEDWHRAGMGANKQRVFDDFHAAAEWLCDHRLTSPETLSISGGSNGGLLVGAALTQRPDLYRSVVCSAALLDMARFEQHGLGRFWSGEYGSASDPDELKTLLTYSPYHRVQDGLTYPATLFTIFASDTRVDPLHARKMCAALQSATLGDPATRPILIRVEREVGHGARAVSRAVALSADTLAFQAWATGLRPR